MGARLSVLVSLCSGPRTVAGVGARSRRGGYFDGMVSSGQLPELVKRANELDAEIKDPVPSPGHGPAECFFPDR